MSRQDNAWREKLQHLAAGAVKFDEAMAMHTSFRVGGTADAYWQPQSAKELADGLSLLKKCAVPITILGNGSNVIVKDGGIRGAVIAFGAPLGKITVEGNKITAEAGAILGAVSRQAADRGLTGLEFAVGIPGSIGGAVYMNAGAYGGEMKDVVTKVTALLPPGERREFFPADFAFGYRHSVFAENGAVIVAVEMRLKPGDKAAIWEKMNDIQAKRKEKQPLELPSAGSTFKRPPGHFAGTLIEKTGLKGFCCGGAEVSRKHAGFIVNAGGATAKDILDLIAEVQNRVYAAHGVKLEPEVKIIGED